MGAYNFTKERKKIYKLHAEGKFFRDIAKECKIRRIEENVPKEELEKIKALAAHKK
ncbi:MAG: hypothetical protein US57_C0011G0126 [Candidatus Moranbacteria bacterium GW2011_GWC2_37_73]|nr:MAG: hypothetical protein US57_C0011G0126 [Candidatus Moranbacteria bacterium GW2011_GWC2_37_73]